jgi:hypothetical protein
VIPAALRKWFSFGSGCGIEIVGRRGAESLRIVAARVRPTGARVVDRLTIEEFPAQAAASWGIDYAAFLSRLGMRHVAATVVLPRQDVIVRHIALPGVSAKDLDAAVRFQLDGLHPYPEDDVTASWARLDGTNVVVAIARRAVIERYESLFAEAGVKIASFTVPAVAVYSALRLFTDTPPSPVLAFEPVLDRVEVYGESPARPIFSASMDSTDLRAASLAASELRIDPATEPRPLGQLLSGHPAFAYSAALVSACPRASLSVNLLPEDRRQSSSRAIWIPSAVLGAIALLLLGALAALPSYENRRYVRALQAEIARVEPQARRAAALERQADNVRRHAAQLDEFRARAKSDMDVLGEMTEILPKNVWLNYLEINGAQVVAGGETEQSAPLLKLIDASPLFETSEFVAPPIRTQVGEMFRIRIHREAGR